MPTLAQARHNKSLTQKQLADELGVNRTLISDWERGLGKPSDRNLRKLCEVLGVSAEEITLGPEAASPLSSGEQARQQTQDQDELMGYVDSTWLRGGRYDVDPAYHERDSG